MDKRFKLAIDIGKRLEAARVAAGVSHADLGECLGYRDETSIYHFVAGRSLLPTWALGACAEKLGVTVDWLLTGTVAGAAAVTHDDARGAVAP